MHEDVFNLPILEKVTVVNYADDIALVLITKPLQDAEL